MFLLFHFDPIDRTLHVSHAVKKKSAMSCQKLITLFRMPYQSPDKYPQPKSHDKPKWVKVHDALRCRYALLPFSSASTSGSHPQRQECSCSNSSRGKPWESEALAILFAERTNACVVNSTLSKPSTSRLVYTRLEVSANFYLLIQLFIRLTAS